MKQTLAQYNKYLQTEPQRQRIIVDAVYSSVRFEGSKTTKKMLNQYYILSKPKAVGKASF